MLFIRKNILALTGLFLCLFLTIHLAGNLILLLPETSARPLYNSYSHALGGNPFIKVVSFVLYFSIILHTLYALVTTAYNRKAKGTLNHHAQAHNWTSQNMGLLGFTILIFIVVHMAQLWARLKLGVGAAVPLDSNGLHDVYQITAEVFKNPWYVVFYSLLMIPLGLHLSHGFSSAFITLGLYSNFYLKVTKKIGFIYSLTISIGFFLIPIVVYLRAQL